MKKYNIFKVLSIFILFAMYIKKIFTRERTCLMCQYIRLDAHTKDCYHMI